MAVLKAQPQAGGLVGGLAAQRFVPALRQMQQPPVVAEIVIPQVRMAVKATCSYQKINHLREFSAELRKSGEWPLPAQDPPWRAQTAANASAGGTS